MVLLRLAKLDDGRFVTVGLLFMAKTVVFAPSCCRQELVDKMFEAVSVTSFDIQREIISCLPEVIDDMQHVDVAHKLK